MKESNYQNWLKKESEWIGSYCNHTRKNSLLKIVPLTLVVSMLLLGCMAFLGSGNTEELLMGAVGGLFFGGVISLFYLAILFTNLRPGKYVRKIEQSIRELSLNESELEQLGQEMLEAWNQKSQVLSYEMVGPNSKGTPARFVVTPHYAFQVGSTPYAALVRLNDIATVQLSSERKTTTTRGANSKTLHFLTLYTIRFYRKDRFDRGLSENDLPDYAMGFFQEDLRDAAAKILQDNGVRVTAQEL